MELRPKNGVLPGTHNVCVCTYHENVKLMIIGVNLPTLSNDELCNYEKCISKIICGSPEESCFFRTCKICSDVTNFKHFLKIILSDHKIDLVQFKQWTNVDRCDIVNLELEVSSLIFFARSWRN